MSLVDDMLGCAETPVWFPFAFDMSQLQACLSCTLRLTAKIAGPGDVSPRVEGLLLNENPMTTLAVNGIQHSLIETVLMFPGAHRFPNMQNPYPAEMALYFRNTIDVSKRICLAIPLQVGVGPANAYFATLDKGIYAGRPTATSLLSPTTEFIVYRGADLRGRSADDSRPRAWCEPVNTVLSYYVSVAPAHITAPDLARLMARAGAGRKGPAKPLTEIVKTRIVNIGMRVEGIKLDGPGVGNTGSSGAVTTKQMKCHRLDEDLDIEGDKVYIGGKRPGTTLADELLRPSDDGDAAVPDSAVQPGDIEKILAIVIGVTIGVLLCGALAYFLWNKTFTNYLPANKIYDIPLPAPKL